MNRFRIGERPGEGAPVIVVGAGPAGLVTARALRDAGVPVRLLDQASRMAGPWRHGQRMPVPGTAGSLPADGATVVRLEDYRRGLDGSVEAGVEVERVDPMFGGWRLATSAGPLAARHVVIATGHPTGLRAMLGHLGVLDENGGPRTVGGHVGPALPGLWFVGTRPALTDHLRDVAASIADDAKAERPACTRRHT